jgi:hypothetical protein
MKLSEENGYLEFLDGVKLAFREYCFVLRIRFRLDTNSEGYRAFKRAKGVRNRLTHPKSDREIRLQQSEIKDVVDAFRWFNGEMIRWKEASLSKDR